MDITEDWLKENHFVKYGEWFELNTLNINVPIIDNYVYVNLEYKKIQLSESSNDDPITLYIPFTAEALGGFIKLYGEPKRRLFH